MSPSDLAAPDRVRPAAGRVPSARPHRRVSSRFLRSETRLLLTRRRNIALLVVLMAIPVLLGVAVHFSSSNPQPGEGPQFLSAVTSNGLFLAFTALVVTLPLFLPLAVGVVSGDAVAGEASTGTLRYLLVTPVERGRLLVVKYVAVCGFVLLGALLVAVTGLLVGLALFPRGDVTLLSGTTVSYLDAVGRALLAAAYVAVSLLGIAAIGLFISTLTEVPIAAMTATVGVAVILEILDAVPQIAWVHPYLAPHYWFAFGDLLRDPIRWSEIISGLELQAAYIAVFAALAWARFTTRDVTS